MKSCTNEQFFSLNSATLYINYRPLAMYLMLSFFFFKMYNVFMLNRFLLLLFLFFLIGFKCMILESLREQLLLIKTRLKIQRPVKIQKLLAREDVTLLYSIHKQRQILM